MRQLTLICQTCGKPIDEGHLGIDTQPVTAYEAAAVAWEAEHGDAGPLAELLTHPEEPQWAAHCEACEPDTCGYCIQAGELATYKGLIKWTAHLMGKSWFAHTDWDDMLEKLTHGTDRRIREVRS